MARQVKLQSETQGYPAGVFLFFGLGYVARALLPTVQRLGFEIYATVRTQEQAKNCRALNVIPLMFNGAVTADLAAALRKTTHILSSVPPSQHGDPIVQVLGENLRANANNTVWAGYLSATSVYGHRNGQWVFEDELLRPSTDRGRRRVIAELDWCESGLPVHIFRLSGIYGTGRNALKTIQKGNAKAIVKDGHITNRIHVDDIASALAASLDCPDPLRVYNLSDGTPSPPQDVLNFAAQLLATTVPNTPYEKAKLSPLARSFYQDERRISNTRAQNQLHWRPRYPSYKEGLSAIFKTGH